MKKSRLSRLPWKKNNSFLHSMWRITFSLSFHQRSPQPESTQWFRFFTPKAFTDATQPGAGDEVKSNLKPSAFWAKILPPPPAPSPLHSHCLSQQVISVNKRQQMVQPCKTELSITSDCTGTSALHYSIINTETCFSILLIICSCVINCKNKTIYGVHVSIFNLNPTVHYYHSNFLLFRGSNEA